MTDSGQIFSAEKTLISDFFREHDKIIYTYDFWDNWEFDITLEKEGTVDQETPLVIRAKWGMIPEDIGGRWALQAYFEYYQNWWYPEYWEETIEFEMDREDDPDILPKESFKNFFEENVLNAPDFDAFEWEDSKEVWKELIEMRNE